MRLLRRRWLGRNPLVNGFWLAMLNGALAALCVAAFMGVVAAVILTAAYDIPTPFPFPLLLACDTMGLLLAWFWFSRRLPPAGRGGAFVTGVLGALPLFALAALGYAQAVWQSIFGDFANNPMLDIGVALTVLISTIIVAAGVTCVAMVTLLAPTAPAAASPRR